MKTQLQVLLKDIFKTGFFKDNLKQTTKEQVFRFLFLFLPVSYLINAIIVHIYYGNYFLSALDPEYFHLFNGVAIAGGNLGVEYIAHPGTPVEYMIAIVVRIINLFQGNEKLVQDVISNPEKYIRGAIIFQNILIAVTLYFGALRMVSFTKKYFTGFLFQLIPFANAAVFEISGRILPETLMILPLMWMVLLMVKYIYAAEEEYNLKKESVKWAAAIGFGVACKLSFAPLFFLPLILLKGKIRDKINFIIYTILSVMFFAYPIVFHFGAFKEWVLGMFMHSGLHGTGDEGLVAVSTLKPNFLILFAHDPKLFLVMAMSVLSLIIVIFKSYVANHEEVSKISRAIIAVDIVLLLSIAFTLKHFAYHYFIPFFTIKAVLVLLIFIMLSQLKVIISTNYGRIALIIVFVAFSALDIHKQRRDLEVTMTWVREKAEQRQARRDEIMRLVDKSTPVIISGPYYGAPFREFAINEGFMMSYKLKCVFKDRLLETYPKSFMYVPWTDGFYHWDTYVDFKKILAKSENGVYVYVGENKSKNLLEIEKRIANTVPLDQLQKDVVFLDEATGEQLIKYTPIFL